MSESFDETALRIWSEVPREEGWHLEFARRLRSEWEGRYNAKAEPAKPIESTESELAAAVEWLRRFSLPEFGASKHAAILLQELAKPAGEPVYIIFDGPPGPEAGRFVEVENADGRSLRAGEWSEYGMFWRLGPLYTHPPIPPADCVVVPREPTEAMLDEAWKTLPMIPLSKYNIAILYRAMLSVAPNAAIVQEEGR